QTELGRAAFYELFSQSEHLQLKDQLDSLVSALDAGSDAILDCTRTADLLSHIQRSIAERRRQRSEEIRRSMTDLANLTPATRARIESALDAGDFLAATE